MAAIFAFKCSCCSKIHEGSPSFAFIAPDHYAGLSEEQKSTMCKKNDDFCIITHDQGTDFFIRTILEVPIHGIEEPFMWGVWVSLSQKSFQRYWDTFDQPVEGEGFFGWVCNEIFVYPSSTSRPADVCVQLGNQRPKVILHRSDDDKDQLVLDQVNGISIQRAQALAEQILHRT